MIDFSEVEQRLDDIVSFFEYEEEDIVAQVLRKRIINRTLNGLDVNGYTFTPYSPKYERYGRLNKGLSTSPVDLWALGNPHMLEAITHMDDHTLFFPAEFVPMAQGNQAKREFFGANADDWQAASDAVAIHYNERF